MSATLPKVLNSAPLRPPASFVAVSNTAAQPSAPIPLQKNASDMVAMTKASVVM